MLYLSKKSYSPIGWVITIIISLILFSVVTPASAVLERDERLTQFTVQVSWNHQFQFAGLYAAIKEGYYNDVGLEVRVKSWQPGVDPVNEVVEGRSDFAVSYGGVVNDALRGQPIKLVMSFFQYSPLVLLSHSPINELSELANKRIMFYESHLLQGLLNKVPEQAGESIVYLKPTGNLSDFIDKKTDLYGAYLTNEPNQLDNLGIDYYVVDPKQYGIQSYGDLLFTSERMVTNQAQRVSDFKKATIKGWEYAIENQLETVEYILANYEVKKTKQALIEEAASSVKFIRSANTPIGDISKPKLFATSGDAFQLGLISEDQLNAFDFKQIVFHGSSLFTEAEQRYIATQPVVKLANDVNWLPFEAINENGQYVGIVPETLNLLSQKTGVQFKAQAELLWKDVKPRMLQGDFEMFSCAVATPERRQTVKFTEPFLSFPNVLLGGLDRDFINDYKELNGKKVSVVKGFWSEELLKSLYPDIELVLVDSAEEGVEMVVDNRAYAYSGNLGAINYLLRESGLDGLHIIGQHEQRYELAMGVHESNPLLFSIVEKGLLEVKNSDEFKRIYQSWFPLSVVDHSHLHDFIMAYKWYFITFLIINFAVIAWFFAKRKEHELLRLIQLKEKEAALSKALCAENELALQKQHREKLESFFAMVVHEIKTPVSMIDSSVQTLKLIPQNDKQEISSRYEVIKTGAKRINYLVDRFLKKQVFDSHAQELSIQKVGLSTFCEKLLQHYDADLVELRILTKQKNCYIDEVLMLFALTNLIDNAVKYGGLNQQLTVSIFDEDSGIVFSVINTGSTINIAHIEEMLSPYIRGESQGDIPGTGLGLFFVDQITKMHSGTLECANFIKGTGTVFKIIVPQKEDD